MKTITSQILAASAALGLLVTMHVPPAPAAGGTNNAAVSKDPPSTPESDATAKGTQGGAMTEPRQTASDRATPQPGPPQAIPPKAQAATSAKPAQPASVATEPKLGPNELRLNFRGAPIEEVLTYLSDAAGFIIQLNTTVRGKVDVWSDQPVTRQEAVELLNSVLNRNGYAAVQNGRVLTVMSRDDAIHGDIPVKVSDDPSSIPKNDEIVTVIIPIRFVEAEQLVKDLSPMIPVHATIIANQAGNSIVVTDTQANIRHLAEIIKAIDSSAEDATEVRVFHLKHHDPTEIANLLTGLFSGQGNANGVQSPIRLGGPGGPGGGFGGGYARFMAANAAAATPGANSRTDRIKKREQVVAVADPRTSSVVVTASKDLIGQIAGMIEQLDQDSPKVAHVSVIHLENADPQQVQQVLQDMFQNGTTARSSSAQTSPLMNRIQQSQNGSTTPTMGTTAPGSSRGGVGGALPSF